MPDQPTSAGDDDSEVMNAAAVLILDALEQEDPPDDRADDGEREAYAWGFRVGTLLTLDLLAYALTTSTFSLERSEQEVYDRLEDAVIALLGERVSNEVEWNLSRILRDEETDQPHADE